MCGRFTLRTDGQALAQHFEIEAAAQPPLDAGQFSLPRYNIAPTQTVPVIRLEPGTAKRELVPQRWGLIPFWAKAATPLPTLFNARLETLASKPAFRDAFRARRCLIPADGFYEWEDTGGKRKQPWFLARRGGALFALAGLYENGTCTVVTTAPIPLLARIHDRMPVIPPPSLYRAWLDPRTDPDALTAALTRGPAPPAPADLAMYRVSDLVNRASEDTPACVTPLAPETPSSRRN